MTNTDENEDKFRGIIIDSIYMRSKCNLFNEYTDESEETTEETVTEPEAETHEKTSFFLPLSNYTDALTGNHLSVNAKLFPSAFICFYIKDYDVSVNNSADINNFVKKITQFYENKTAFLKDCVNCGYGDIKNKDISPLPMLVHYLKEKCSDIDFEITYVGNITEQDYDGTYADMMCTIEAGTDTYKYDLDSDSVINSDKYTFLEYITNANNLYGWSYKNSDDEYVYNGPASYKNVAPEFDKVEDGKNYYYINDSDVYNGITCDKSEENKPNQVKFNFVVPLFSVYLDDYTTERPVTENFVHEDGDLRDDNKYWVLNFGDFNNKEYNPSGRTLYNTLVPYGIWWSGYKPVTLDRSNNENPSWTLVLSSQFKPFPYSQKYDPTDSKNSSSDKSVHNSFAEILARQNNAIDKIMEQDKTISELRKEIDTLKSLVTSKN